MKETRHLNHSTLMLVLAGLSFVSQAGAQSISIIHDHAQNRIQLDVATIPTEQCWLVESTSLVAWNRRAFVDYAMQIPLGQPIPGSHFFKLEPLYGTLVWPSTSNMPVARDQFTGGIINGKLYLFGGNGDPNGDDLSRLDICDLSSGVWTSGADYSFGMEELTSAVVGGKLYVFGYENPTHVNTCYDPITNTWQNIAPKPTKIQATTAVARGDEILTVGGWLPGGGTTDIVEAYDTVSNTWRHVTQFPEPIYAAGIGIVEDVLYLVGGLDLQIPAFHNKVFRYNLTNNLWLPTLVGALPQPVFAVYSSACPVVNGRIMIAGGGTSSTGGWTAPALVMTDRITVFDTHSGTASTNTPLPRPTDDHLVLLANDKLLVIGGETPARTNEIITGEFQR